MPDKEVRSAVRRVRTFLTLREEHYRDRRKAEMFGAAKNPMPDEICAEYDTLDIKDLHTICDAIMGAK